ncbi:MAG: PAS domain-containing protein [Chloroflexi bacterium]|nr:PAS domain-containing protein [Chloroflexota bacterium]
MGRTSAGGRADPANIQPGRPPLDTHRGMRRLFPRSVRGILMLLLLVVILPFLVIEAVHYDKLFEDRRSKEFATNMELARAVGAGFGDFVRSILGQELTIGTTITSLRPTSDEQIVRLLAVSANEHPSVRHYAWVSPQGRIIASSYLDEIGLDVSDRSFFPGIVGGREWSVTNLFQGRLNGETLFVIARGIRDERGTLLGIVAADVDPTRLGEAVRVERAGNAAVVIIDGQGWGVYRFPEIELGWERRNWIAINPVIGRALAGEEVVATILGTQNEKRMAAYTPIRSIGWVASASVTEDEAMGPIFQEIIRQSALDLTVIVVVFLVALLIGRYITAPTRRLREYAETLGRGEYDRRLELTGPAELEVLAGTLNRMAAEIGARERELWEREEWYRALAETAHDMIFVLNRDLRVQYINATAAAQIGLPPAEIVGRWQEEFFPPEISARQQHSVQEVFRTGQPVYRENRTAFPRHEMWMDTWLSPIRNASGEVVAVLGISRDVSERKRNEEFREQYIHTVSHDLRNPLAIIQGNAQLILRRLEKAGRPSERDSEHDAEHKSVKAIAASARRMNAMIEDLADSARLEAGQLRLERQPVDLQPFLGKLLEHAEGIMEVGRIEAQVASNLPPVSADPDRLERILINLVSNALKYSPSDTGVVVRAEKTDGEVSISVADMGIGIAPEDLPHIFERFYETRAGRRTGGIGLGLYITKMLVEAHGGRIWVESELDKGSTFCFTLRAQGAPEAPIA